MTIYNGDRLIMVHVPADCDLRVGDEVVAQQDAVFGTVKVARSLDNPFRRWFIVSTEDVAPKPDQGTGR